MKKWYAIALAGAIFSGLGLIQPSVSNAATSCNGPLGAVTIAGNLTVTGACVLNGTTVTGSITMATPGTSLTMKGATVNGSVTQSAGTLASFNSTIRGSVTVTGTDEDSLNDICGGSIGGSVTVRNVTETSAGNLGYFRLLGMGAPIPTNGPCSTVVGSIAPLTIGGSVTFTNNQIYVRLGGASKVGGTVTVNDNKSETYDDDSADISANTIKGSLTCLNNTPPPSNLLGANTVSGARRFQCAGF